MKVPLLSFTEIAAADLQEVKTTLLKLLSDNDGIWVHVHAR